METYLQTAWGDQWYDVTMDIVRKAIEKIKTMDDEHGAFWVGLIKEDENVLEVNKDLELIGIFEEKPNIEYKGHGEDWHDIEILFQTFLSDKMEIVKARLKIPSI